MKFLIPCFLIAAITWSCSNDKKQPAGAEDKPAIAVDSTLVTDSGWGLINQKTDLAELQRIFGAGNVKDDSICGPECADTIAVTKVYPDTKREIVVYWKDSMYHKKIVSVESRTPEAPYHTASNLKIGSTLGDMVKVNGQKINFSGFGWDYGGYIQSLNNGTLEKSNVHFQLDSPEGANDLAGDRELNTDMPSVKKSIDKIYLVVISLTFD